MNKEQTVHNNKNQISGNNPLKIDSKKMDANKKSVEAQILDLLRNRNPEGLNKLISKYHEKLFSVANQILKNPSDAEDILQDVYMTALNKIDQFQERSTLSTWLYRITVNAALMKIRAQRSKKDTVSLESVAAILSEKGNTRHTDEQLASPDNMLMNKELLSQIVDSVETLPEIYQNVFFLRDVQGLSIKETSKLLKATPAAVKSRLHRSRLFLRENLNQYVCEPGR